VRVANKVFVVTGAGSGIGRALAFTLLLRGAKVAGVDLNPDSLEETAKLAVKWKGDFANYTANIADRAAVQALPERIVSDFGHVDGIINNAGIIQPFARLNDLDYPTIERVINVNFLGTLFVTKAFLPHLLERPEAHIANISSMGGFVPVPGQTVYGAAKAAVKLMTEGLASELLHTKVRVSVVFPGAIATNIMANSGVNLRDMNAEGGGGMKTLSPANAAEIIVNGIERNAYQIFVGKDAVLMDKLYRLNPKFAAGMIAGKMGALLPDQG
jgi:NAD(P)-dependent dehydrogenase (short-subunit alcohol dehydrogenase family)